MAKAKPKAKTVNKKPSTAVAKTGVGTKVSSTAPAYLKTYRGPLGSEDIEASDITIPRLKIGQAMSDEVKDGLIEEGSLFLNVSAEPLWKPGDEPMPAVIVARNAEYILWRPRKDGGGILARAKPEKTKQGLRYRWDKPNQSFQVKIDGKHAVTWKTKTFVDEDGLGDWGSEIPGNKESGIAATKHHNYVVVLPEHDNIVCAMSLARSGVKKAKDLNAIIKMRGAVPIQAGMYALTTIDEQNDLGKYKNLKVINAGWVPEGDFEVFDQIAKGFQQTGFKVDQADADKDEVGANTDDM